MRRRLPNSSTDASGGLPRWFKHDLAARSSRDFSGGKETFLFVVSKACDHTSAFTSGTQPQHLSLPHRAPSPPLHSLPLQAQHSRISSHSLHLQLQSRQASMFHHIRRRNIMALPSNSLPATAAATDKRNACPICFELLPPKPRPGFLSFLRSKQGPTVGNGRVWCASDHAYCTACLGTYVAVSISEGKTSHGTLRCPAEKCTTPLPEPLLRTLVSHEAWKKHRQFVKEAKVGKDPLLRWCPQPNCAGVARLTHAPRRCHDGHYVAATCPVCTHTFCGSCGEGPHGKEGCDKAGDQAYAMWKKRKGDAVKPCPGCGHHVEKTGGCNALVCSRCRSKFCWGCGLKAGACKCLSMRFAVWHDELQPVPPLRTLLNGLIVIVAMAWALAFLSVWIFVLLFYGPDEMVRRILFHRHVLYEAWTIILQDLRDLVAWLLSQLGGRD